MQTKQAPKIPLKSTEMLISVNIPTLNPINVSHIITTAVCKVRGLKLLLWDGTVWRCGDGLFFEVPPLASDVHF